MKQEDFELTAGIEVHQQLDTNKLFCNCPSTIRDDKPEFTVTRMLRASGGEDGETDIAAKHEAHKRKHYHYQGYSDSTCLIELDEEPVASLNEQALTIALQVAKLLNLTLVDEIHVMRKTVVDGSNTSGFQRTAIIGLNGHIEVDGKRIKIEQLCLEEDSANIVERSDTHDTYNLSRLGIPLLEITTGPDIHSPEEVKKVAAYIGMLLRSTEKVKRGLGTIRQDVNISVPGGNRVEIKGVQDLDSLALLVENETKRQRALINLSKIIPIQQYSINECTEALKTTKAKRIASMLEQGSKAIGIRLADWKEALYSELTSNVKLGKELAGYAKAHGFGGLIHSAEDLSKYPFSDEEIKKLQTILHCVENDAWIIMVGDEKKLEVFYKEVLIPRLNQLTKGVPKEVRKAEMDNTTTYLRPMPGANRMYPETDVRTIIPDSSKVIIPELITHKSKRLQKEYAISADLADQLCKEGVASIFELWTKTYNNITPTIIASLLGSKEKEIKTRHNIEIDFTKYGPEILSHLNSGAISVASVEDILLQLVKGEPIDYAHYKPVDEEEIHRVVEKFIRDNPQASIGLLMGKVMRHFENKVDGKKVQELLQTEMKKK